MPENEEDMLSEIIAEEEKENNANIPEEPSDDEIPPLVIPEAGFEETLEDADISGIVPSYKGKKDRSYSSSFFIRIAALTVCLAIFGYCAYSIADRIIDSMKSDEIMDEIWESANADSAVTRLTKAKTASDKLCFYDSLGVTETETQWEEEISTEYDAILNTLSMLKTVNKDIYGWVRCVGGMAGVNYPVVRANDNSYYLRRDIYGNYSMAGTIFVDARNSKDHLQNLNTILYGHNMTNGTMFRAVKEWYDSATRNSSAQLITIELITLDATYIYDIFSAYRATGAEFVSVSFPSTDDYVKFLKSISKKSVLGYHLPYDENTRILTFSTCTNAGISEDERYVVHAKLRKIVKYN